MVEQLSSGGANINKVEQALNEWLEKVEEQVNTVQDTLSLKADMADLGQLEKKLQLEARERAFNDEQAVKVAHNAEQLCNRLADDALG